MPVPVHTNSIGAFTFFDLTGSIFLRSEELELLARRGIDGHGMRRLGKRGTPFSLRSVAYHTSFQTAKDALVTYVALKGAVPQAVIRNTVNFGTYFVLDAREIRTQACFNVVNVPGAQARAEVEWTLLG